MTTFKLFLKSIDMFGFILNDATEEEFLISSGKLL
jgi:hypothetical protein